MTRVRTAVFPVAGLGTRFLPATKAIPKEMLTVVDRPVLQYAVQEAKEAGIERFIFVASRGKTVMEDHFDAHPELEAVLEQREKAVELTAVRDASIPPGNLTIVRQDAPKGLGHAVWCARDAVGDEPFAVLLPDEVLRGSPGCTSRLIELQQREGSVHALAVCEVPPADTRRYGILAPAGEADGAPFRASGMVEKPAPEDAPSSWAAIGRYVLDPTVFDALAAGRRGAGGEIQLTDAIAATTDRAPLWGVPFDGERYDCGDRFGFLKANVAFALERDGLGAELRRWLAGRL